MKWNYSSSSEEIIVDILLGPQLYRLVPYTSVEDQEDLKQLPPKLPSPLIRQRVAILYIFTIDVNDWNN